MKTAAPSRADWDPALQQETALVEPAGRAQVGRRAEAIIRFLLAVALAAVLCLAVRRLIPVQLGVRTDIVGYPIFANYNIERILDEYYLLVVGFPLSAFALYVTLGLASRHLGWRTDAVAPERLSEHDGAAGAGERLQVLAAVLRLLAVGFGFGLEAAMATGAAGPALAATLTAVPLLYAALVLGPMAAAWRAVVANGGRLPTLAVLNAVLAPLSVTGLAWVAAATTVTVRSDDAVHRYPWLPVWIVAPLTAALVAWIAVALRRGVSPERVRFIERRAVTLITGSVCLFLLVGMLPGATGAIDAFHDGESLAASRLLRAGYFPWRDVMSIHGLLQDQLSPIPGQLLFSDTWWGSTAGRELLLEPLSLVFLYIFAAVLFERSWPLVAAGAAMIVGGSLAISFPGVPYHLNVLVPIVDTRYMTWPLVLVLAWAALRSSKLWPSTVLGAALVVEGVLVPETAYGIAAIVAVVALHDLTQWRSARERRLGRSLAVAGGGLAVAGLVAVELQVQGALKDFFLYYLVFARGHELTGGLPVNPASWLQSPAFALAAFAPLAAMLASAWYFGAGLVQRRQLDPLDSVMGAQTLFTIAYYTKFLDRADTHVYESYAVAIPLLGMLAYRGCEAADRWLWGRRLSQRLTIRIGTRPVAYLVLLATLAGTAGGLLARVSGAPALIRVVVPNEPTLSGVGYSSSSPVDPATYSDLSAVFGAYLRPGDWVFDFTNEPALFYYLLGQRPRTRYYHVSMAIPEVAQEDLIADLQRDRPRLVVFSSERYGLPAWDGIPNMVRHYDVSQYILDHYRPLISVDGEILYADASSSLSPQTALGLGLRSSPVTDQLPFRGPPCDWGAAPNFLAISPPPRAGASAPATLQARSAGVGAASLSGWAVDAAGGGALREVVLVVDGRVVGRVVPDLPRPDLTAVGPAGATAGFRAELPGSAYTTGEDVRPIQVFGITRAGAAGELHYGRAAAPWATGSGPELAALDLGGGEVVPVRAGAVDGFVDTAASRPHMLALQPPVGATWSDYRWLEIDSSTRGLQPDSWQLSDDESGNLQREVVFKTLTGLAHTIRVDVGSCAQWHGYDRAPLYLSSQRGEGSLMIRVLP